MSGDDATATTGAASRLEETDGGFKASSICHLRSSIFAITTSVSLTSVSTSSSVHCDKMSRL